MKFKFLLFSFILVLTVTTSQAQVKADFSTNGSSGCSPLKVQFRSKATGNVTSWKWNFGNGNTSTQINPVMSFSTPGKYKVTLVVSDGVNTDTSVDTYITVFKNPSAQFTTTTLKTGCNPLSVSFKDVSVQGDTNISKWTWDFGDGVISTIAEPSHTYTLSGPFPVSLKVIDANTCENALSVADYINVSDAPKAIFNTTDPVEACAAPFKINFKNTSTGAGKLEYAWDFGDGTTSDLKEPAHTFLDFGVFTVSLKVTDPNGCSNTSIRNSMVKIINVKAGFTPSTKTACKGIPVTFTNTSTGGVSNAWTFGDGPGSSSSNPSHTYNLPGKYPVTLTTSTGLLCKDTYKDTIVVEEVIAKFTSDLHYGCDTFLLVKFTDQSTNAVSWDWDFGIIGSHLQNPSYLYRINTWDQLVSFDNKLTVTSKYGCTDVMTIPKNVNMFAIQPVITADKFKGCAPLTVNFKDITVSRDSAASFFWDFGDGNTSNVENPTHTFATPDSFIVRLTITSKYGCKSDTTLIIKTGIKPHPDFKLVEDTSCAYDLVHFIDLSTDAKLVDSWEWRFGDGGGDVVRYPQYMYTDTGYMNVFLKVGIRGCYDSIMKPKQVYIKGPITTVFATMDCKKPLEYKFNAEMIDAQRFYWDFNDGSPLDSVSLNPTHTFPSTIPGDNRNVMLFSLNDSNKCIYKSREIVHVREIKAAFTQEKIKGCAPLSIGFDGGISHDEELGYSWKWGDGSPDTISNGGFARHIYQNAGKFYPQLIVKDYNGCRDTIKHLVSVYKPKVDFSHSTLKECVPANFVFTDKTVGDTTLVKWIWSFGDNTFSSDTNTTHTYLSPGIKTISLTVTDTLQCSDTKSITVDVTQPIASFIAAGDRKLCLGEPVSFINSSSGINLVSYKWKFGDGDSLITATLTNPVHTYKDSGTYTVSLTVTEHNGCDSTKKMLNYIAVQRNPDPQFFANTIISNCYPLLVTFKDTSQTKYIKSYLWDFGNNQARSNIAVPSYNYTLPGIYTVKLKLTTTFDCTKELTKPDYIEVRGPFAQDTLSNDTICKGGSITFTVKNENQYANNFEWDFGDGTPFGKGKSVTHQYDQLGILYTRLIYSSLDSTCEKDDPGVVYVEEVVANFGIDKPVGCLPHNIQVTDSSTGPSKWNWDFGNGQKSILKSPPAIVYQNPGLYPVKLAIENNHGCKDETSKNVRVHPLPVVTVTKDSLICLGEKIQLVAKGGKKYLWTPKESLNNDIIFNPLATPEITTQYTVVATDSNSCKASASVKVTVQQPPVVTLKDTTIIIGETVKLNAAAGEGFSYLWTPSKGLSCTTCPDPEGQPLDSTLYTVIISDENNCFNTERSAYIKVRQAYSIEVPTAFTPGKDRNNVVYINGWGIKKLIDWKIYNRWGQLVFESNDLKHGWDGYFNGQLQNTETYVYVINALMYDEKIKSKKGNISLLR